MQKKGLECRHNKGYWQRTDYLGLGLGASSLIDHIRFSNTDNMEEYIKNSRQPEKIRCDMERLSETDEMAEFMFLGLRMTEGVSMDVFEEYFGKKNGKYLRGCAEKTSVYRNAGEKREQDISYKKRNSCE